MTWFTDSPYERMMTRRPEGGKDTCLSLFYMISGGNATRSKRLGFKNPNNILCRFTVLASAPFPVLSVGLLMR